MADTIDVLHGERGFATGGTLLRLEHVARAAGLEPAKLRRSFDEAALRFIVKQQIEFQKVMHLFLDLIIMVFTNVHE